MTINKHNKKLDKYSEDINEENYKSLKIYSLGICVLSAILSSFGLFTSLVKEVYIYWIVICLIFVVLSWTKIKFVKKNATLFLYIFTIAMLLSIIVANGLWSSSGYITLFVGFLMGFAYIVTDKIIRIITSEVILCIIFCVVTIMFKKTESAFVDCIYACGFTAFTCLGSYLTISSKLSAIDSKNLLIKQRDTDDLTGVLSRKAAEKIIKNIISDNKSKNYSMILLDLDRFKIINDTLGHLEGDKVLIKTAQILTDVFEDSACIARIGGDEFIVFIENVDDSLKDKLVDMNERIRKIKLAIPHSNIYFSSSAGAVVASGKKNYDTLYLSADRAMYQAKETGRNNYKIKVLQ